jgi:hypothetical protein
MKQVIIHFSSLPLLDTCRQQTAYSVQTPLNVYKIKNATTIINNVDKHRFVFLFIYPYRPRIICIPAGI